MVISPIFNYPLHLLFPFGLPVLITTIPFGVAITASFCGVLSLYNSTIIPCCLHNNWKFLKWTVVVQLRWSELVPIALTVVEFTVRGVNQDLVAFGVFTDITTVDAIEVILIINIPNTNNFFIIFTPYISEV